MIELIYDFKTIKYYSIEIDNCTQFLLERNGRILKPPAFVENRAQIPPLQAMCITKVKKSMHRGVAIFCSHLTLKMDTY